MSCRITVALTLALLVIACGDHGTAPSDPLAPDGPVGAISDAATDLSGNPGFWWLPPMVPQPTLTGTFQAALSPKIVVEDCAIVECENVIAQPLESSVTSGIFAEFTRQNGGLIVDADHFKVEFDTHAFGLNTTSTYRILAWTDPLTEFGGPFILGFADFQVAENGQEAKNLQTGEMIALVDGRTLPIKFFANEVAYPHELEQHALANPDSENTYCEINCSVTIIPTDQQTEASLPSSTGTGEAVALLFRAGDVQEPSVLVLDEREETANGNCAPTINLNKLNCIRATISPDLAFVNPVRFGLSPCNVPLGPGTAYVIKKDDDGVLTEPVQDLDVSDFFDASCASTVGFGDGGFTRFAVAVLDFFVPPLFAGDSTKSGGELKSLSDLFWAEDAWAVQDISGGQFEAGATSPLAIRVEARHQDPPVPLANHEVIYTMQSRVGGVATSGGVPGPGPVSLLTGTDGYATAELTVAAGTNIVQAETPTALGGPLFFTFTGLGLISRWNADATAPDAFGDVAAVNHGVVTGTVPLEPGVEGTNAFRFNGDGSVINAPATDWGDAKKITASLWVNIDPASSTLRVQRFITAAPGEKFALRQNHQGEGSTGRQLEFYMGFGVEDASFSNLRRMSVNNVLRAGCWQHVAGTYDGTTMRAYVDGVQVGELVVDDTLRDKSMSVHNMFLSSPSAVADDGSGEALEGRLDDIRVYNKALTAAEIAALAGDAPIGCQADLAITSSDHSVVPDTVNPGDVVDVSGWSADNIGNEDVPAGTVVNAGYYLSNDATITSADVLLGSSDLVGTGGWAIGQVVSRGVLSFTIPSTTAAGDYWVGVLLDNDGTVAESGETNNTWSVPIRVLDPIIVTVSPSEPDLEVGDQVQLTGAVTQGDQVISTSLTWVSTNVAVATVDTSGIVTGVAPGLATIIATATVDGTTYSGSAGATVLADSRLLTYTFDGNVENSGSLSGFTGTATSVSYPEGKFGRAIKFDGTTATGAVLTGTGTVFENNGSEWTISLWFKEDQQVTWVTLWSFRGADQGWESYHGVTAEQITTCSDGGCFGFKPPAAVWHNIIYRYDGVSATEGAPVEIFVDGVLAGQLANTNSIPLVGGGVTDIQIGNSSIFYVDEFRVYNTVFTPKQQCTLVTGGTWSTVNGTCTLP